MQTINDEVTRAVTEYLVKELGKLPEVKKVSLVSSVDNRYIDLIITITKMENPDNLHESRRDALDRLKTDVGMELDSQRIRMAILDGAAHAYIGHLKDAGAGSTIEPIEHFHFDPNITRVLYRNPPKKEKKKRVEKYDPLWAKAKKLCRLNQEEIQMAKELHMSPRGLMKNIPSPKQQWKLPVKLWIRELYEKRHPGKGFRPEPPPRPDPPLSQEDEEFARRQFEEQMFWEDYADRNDLLMPKKKTKGAPTKSATIVPSVRPTVSRDQSFLDELFLPKEVTEDDLPF